MPQFSEFPIEKASEDDLVHNVFLDPSGRHFIVSMQSGDNFYLSRAGTRFRTMDKAKVSRNKKIKVF